jgi:cytoskeletal protein CcmA (bactofilin family)
MDPSQAQSDKSNDVHSLEQDDESKDAGSKAPAAGVAKAAPPAAGQKTDESGVTDATGGTAPEAAAPAPKKNPFKRFWEKFNLYLVLFILVIVVAVGILVTLTIKSKQTTKNALDSQNLSQQELQQLASTDVTVGTPKQLLTVQANAVFAGAVLVRSNLEVAGSLKVGGELSLTTLKVTGATQLADAQVSNLTVSGALNVLGALALKSGISVSGNSNFTGNVTTASLTTGNLNLNGDLALTHHISAGGPTPSIARGTATGGGGTVSLSGSDTAGSITVNTGSAPPAGCFATITFSQKFTSTPHVVITPIGSGSADLQYYIDRTTSNFTICASNPATAGQSFGFDYMALD